MLTKGEIMDEMAFPLVVGHVRIIKVINVFLKFKTKSYQFNRVEEILS